MQDCLLWLCTGNDASVNLKLNTVIHFSVTWLAVHKLQPWGDLSMLPCLDLCDLAEARHQFTIVQLRLMTPDHYNNAAEQIWGSAGKSCYLNKCTDNLARHISNI